MEILGEYSDSEPSEGSTRPWLKPRKPVRVGRRNACHDPGIARDHGRSTTKDISALEKVRDDMLTVLEEVVQKGVTQEEVDRARQQILKNRELAAVDPNRIAIELSEWSAQGDWRLYFLNRDRIEQVTPEQVKQVAANYFTPSNRTVGFFVPTKKAERTPVPPFPTSPSSSTAMPAASSSRLQPRRPTSHRLPSKLDCKRPEPIGGIKLAPAPRKPGTNPCCCV